MAWTVLFHPKFVGGYREFSEVVQDELIAHLRYLREVGPNLRRPHADTLKGSRHDNMKELRFSADGGVWRVAFAFDPHRQAILLVAGDKSGVTSDRFYKKLISIADVRFDEHLAHLEQKK